MSSKKRGTRKFISQGNFYAYILECHDGTYYTGSTNNLQKRIFSHENGNGAKYTRGRRPVKLVWCKKYRYFKEAFLEERRIKRLTKGQKESLIVNQG